MEEHYNHDGEAEMWLPTQEELDARTSMTMVKEYNDGKGFAGCALVFIALTGIAFLVALCYSVADIFLYLISQIK